MKIQVKYFASLKEQARKSQEVIDFDGDNPQQLWECLASQYGFKIHLPDLKVAINHEYADFQKPLKENDLVVFIPPVAGG